MPRIGHFGFFRPASREPLWEGVLRPELALR
jgi:predicted alpha/beta hydrolase